jgi:cytochrome c oxidase assembly protein subunit 15
MAAILAKQTSSLRAVRVWLVVVAAMIALMVLVGGATRLTESGLSITEWKPVAGALPPLGETQWEQVFEAYKQIPQYRALNAGMTLPEFKTIFWWEWSHRLLGRVIGMVYLLPFLFFLWRGGLSAELKRRLWLIFGLGAVQGAVGWWMVASGLSERIEVSQYRLATHLVLALLIFAAIVWTLRMLGDRTPLAAPARLRITAVVLVALTFVQLYLGALVAGLRAGLVYNTWPEIDGAFIPAGARLWFDTPWWRNLFENPLTVQFEHRMTAYALFLLAVFHAVDAMRARARGVAVNGALWLVAAVTLQATLGVLTLLNQVPIALALSHQAVALAVLMLAVTQAERLATGAADPTSQGVAVPVALSRQQ